MFGDLNLSLDLLLLVKVYWCCKVILLFEFVLRLNDVGCRCGCRFLSWSCKLVNE